jgi:hypothetical protein
MVIFSPKVEIINHFDGLINRVDIDIESALETNSECQILGDLECFEIEKRNVGSDSKFKLDFFDSYKSPLENNQWSESTKVVDYLNHVRMRTIADLRKVQEESLENSSRFNHLRVEFKDEANKEELKSQLFADRFYFQIELKSTKTLSWILKLYTIITDFYLPQSDINLLQ